MHGRDIKSGGERVSRARNPRYVEDFAPGDLLEIEGDVVAMVTAKGISGVPWVRDRLPDGWGEFRPVKKRTRAKLFGG